MIHEVRKDIFQLGKFILAALTLGIVFGLIEGAYNWILFLAGKTLPVDHEVIWSTAVVYGLIYLLLAALIGFLYVVFTMIMSKGRFRPLFMPLIDMLCFLGFLVVINVTLPVAAWARVLLSAGLTVQTHLWLSRRKQGAISYLSGKALTLSLIVLSLFIVTTAIQRGYSLLNLAQLPPAQQDSPNVILITIDTLRADHLSAYGYPRLTPNIDRVAREGVKFDYALSTSSWTLPSFSTIMTGLYSHQHQADEFSGVKLDDQYQTLAEAFSQNGYQTAGFVANFLYCTGSKGLDQGFGEYNDIFWNFEDMVRLTRMGFYLTNYIRLEEAFGWHYLGRKSAEEINREFMDWLPEEQTRPYFIWLNYFDTHDPYDSPDEFNKFGSKHASGNPGNYWLAGASLYGETLSPEDTQAQLDAYDNSVSYIDTQLGELFAYLNERGLYENSIIVITADHGEAFGEHQLYGHGNSLYRETLHVPLIIRYPKLIQGGKSIHQAVSLQRLAATIQDLAQLRLEVDFPGISLFEAGISEEPLISELASAADFPRTHPISRGDLVSFTTSDWHVIFTGDQAEVFAFGDYLDQVELSSTAEGQAVIAEYHQMLNRLHR